MVIDYSEEMLSVAKEYLRDRLRNEGSMRQAVERVLGMYAGYLLDALWRGASDDDLEVLLADLVSLLLSDCETLAVDEHESRRDAILLFIGREVGGDTLAGRVEKRAQTFLVEVAAAVAAGKLLGWSKDAVLKSVRDNLQHPWESELMVAAREAALPGDERFMMPHFGQGVPVSSKTALEFITVHAVGEGWNEYEHEEAVAAGAVGYYVVRGSSYPCDVCDEAASFFHPIEDESYLPCLHPHCVCMAVYVYEG